MGPTTSYFIRRANRPRAESRKFYSNDRTLCFFNTHFNTVQQTLLLENNYVSL